MSVFEHILLSDRLYWALAIGGTALFILRMAMMVIGIDHEDQSDDGDFKILTVHSLTGFAMLFGWIGLACRKQTGLGDGWSLLVAIGAGLAMMIVTSLIFSLARRLSSKGSDFSIEQAIGKAGTVYQRIPAGGSGKVHVLVDDVMHELLATSKEEKASFESIEVIGIANKQTVEVL